MPFAAEMEERMKRKSIMKGMSLGLAAIMTAGLLAGCGSKETSGGQDTPVQEEQTQEEQSQPCLLYTSCGTVR